MLECCSTARLDGLFESRDRLGAEKLLSQDDEYDCHTYYTNRQVNAETPSPVCAREVSYQIVSSCFYVGGGSAISHLRPLDQSRMTRRR